MENEKVVFVRCVFLRGAFPHQRVFVIRLEDGWEYRGVAPVAYCFTSDRKPLGEAPEDGSEAEGLILGVLIVQVEGRIARVYLPDGEIYELSEDQFEVPQRVRSDANVPVES